LQRFADMRETIPFVIGAGVMDMEQIEPAAIAAFPEGRAGS